MEFPYSFYIALDGNGLNGLEGRAGMCAFRYDPESKKYDYLIKYYDGMAGGHAVSVSPNGKVGFLGSTGQHLMFFDTQTLEEIGRVSTLWYESTNSSIKGSTHAVWMNDEEVIVAIGESLWSINIKDLDKAEVIAKHGLKVPHALKKTASGNYLVYGGMDHPEEGEAKEVGILDLQTKEVRKIELPATCWHVACHPTEDKFYALSFRVLPQGGDWHEWAISLFKEYVFEIDAVSGKVLRHWSAGQDLHAHINSDVCLSEQELIYCNGASGTIVMIDRDDFSSFRMIDERPKFLARLGATRQRMRTFIDSMTRGSIFTNGHFHLRALRASRWTMLDSVYACQLSSDQKYLFTANRGLNTITVYNYPDNTVNLSVKMPSMQQYDDTLKWWGDPRLGFHHSTLRTTLTPLQQNTNENKNNALRV
ncbi:hypothetical protein [Pseudoalteromonas sp. OOF1S-7]|uniref:hypothetical protein n=1 Tax=Pseudoalteromonas sp. OOF1S-7 TaxID=2917757 RepID=UPI001EF51E05|nr:hypothetical protein [Pseudoalteromonas sp. OOF1S-7]MCG7537522.1 hypothetical protein [Pseudoalteromonas sp. OOF1S-7]